MKDEHNRSTRFGSDSREMHWQATRHDDRFAPRATDHSALRSFEARLSGERVPSLGAGMPMDERRHAWGEDHLHILRRVLRGQTYGKWTDFRDARAAGGAPPGGVDREQPDFPKRLDNRSTRSSGRLRGGARRIGIQMPKDRPMRQLPQRLVAN